MADTSGFKPLMRRPPVRFSPPLSIAGLFRALGPCSTRCTICLRSRSDEFLECRAGSWTPGNYYPVALKGICDPHPDHGGFATAGGRCGPETIRCAAVADDRRGHE